MIKAAASILQFSLGISIALAQIPDGYYSTADGLTGEALKNALNNIINNHTEFSYTSSSTDTWDILKEADQDPVDASMVLCVYSGFKRDAEDEFADGSGWNREHVWPRSRGDFDTSRGIGTDVHNLRAADVSTNSARSNRNFVESCETQYNDGDGLTDSFTCSSIFGWEPRDDVKGDIARILFYMATRYEGNNGELDLELTDDLQGQQDKSPLHAQLSVLLEWHQVDPVDAFEVNRNDVIFSYQGNRNPYIDHPEWVSAVFDTLTVEGPLHLSIEAKPDISIYPNPVVSGRITIETFMNTTTQFQLSNIQGQIVRRGLLGSGKQILDLSDVPNGIYVLNAQASDGESTHRILVR